MGDEIKEKKDIEVFNSINQFVYVLFLSTFSGWLT